MEQLHASDPAHRGFFSALFCCLVVVKALAAEPGGNVLDPPALIAMEAALSSAEQPDAFPSSQMWKCFWSFSQWAAGFSFLVLDPDHMQVLTL